MSDIYIFPTEPVEPFELLIANESGYNLTKNRVYVNRVNMPAYVRVENDKGDIELYSKDFFRFYHGERIE